MKRIGEQMESFYKRKVIGSETCDKCNQKYEIYDIYIQGKKTWHIDYCSPCQKKEEDEQIRKEAMERRQKARVKRFEYYSELPFDLKGKTFNDYKPTNELQRQAKETSIKFSQKELDKTTLFFQGDTGLGKSHLSYCIYKQFEQEGAIFIDLPSLLSDIRNTYNNGNDYRQKTQERIMQSINECELLVLDDIGAEYIKPDASGFESWAADILFQIVNSRQGKKNVYTTNFTSKYLNQKYGMMSKRIISRLMSNAKVIKVEGKDYRLKGLE